MFRIFMQSYARFARLVFYSFFRSRGTLGELGLRRFVLLCFVVEVPLKTTIERDIVPEAIGEGELLITGVDENAEDAPADGTVRDAASTAAGSVRPEQEPGKDRPRTRPRP